MIVKKHIWLSFLIFILIGNSIALAQEKKNEIPEYLLVHLTFSFQNPSGDMDDRFGRSNTAGLGIDYLTSKNWILGTQIDYLFGSRVNEDVLSSLRNSNGDIIGNNRGISNIRLTMRGLNASVFGGKLIPFQKSKPRFGIRITAGVGMLQHKVRIQQDPASLVPQTTGDYRTGYDRLSNGLAFTEFIGIQKVSRNKKINFILGLEMVQGFRKSRREWDYDKRAKDTNQYFDILLGGKLGWTIPFEIGRNPDELFY